MQLKDVIEQFSEEGLLKLVTALFCITAASQVYDKFLRDVWEHKDEVEKAYGDEPSPPPAYDMNFQRPPAPLPSQQYYTHTSKSTSSNRLVHNQFLVASFVAITHKRLQD